MTLLPQFSSGLFSDTQALKENMDALMPRLRDATIVASLLGLVFVIVLYQRVPLHELVSWYSIVLVFTAIRWIGKYYYQRQSWSDTQLKKWGLFFISLYLIGGIIWGMSGWHFIIPDDPILFTLVILSLCGIAAGTLNPASLLPPSYFLFVFPCLLPMILRFYTLEGSNFVLLSFTVMSLLFAFIAFAKVANNLKQQVKIAQEASRQKSQFLAAASHDLRQPLHSLSLLVNALGARLEMSEHGILFNKIDTCVSNLEKLFNSLLDISKLDAGVIDVHQLHFDISEITQILHTEYESIAKDKGLMLNIEDNHTIVFCDKLLLQRILKNLLNNALSYTSEGSVSVLFHQTNSELVISIKDSGNGIPQSQLSNIFIEFQQLNNPERDREKGLGLGLAIVKRLCDLLKLKIDVQSTINKGSTFSIHILLGDKKKRILQTEPYTPANWQFDDLQVLVIDDDQSTCEAMYILLSDWGCKVQVAEDMQSVHNILKPGIFTPDIIISDYRLRENMNGLYVIDTIKKHYNISPACLLISGDTSPEQLRIIEESGYTLLHKPVKPVLLRRAIFNLTRHIDNEGKTGI